MGKKDWGNDNEDIHPSYPNGLQLDNLQTSLVKNHLLLLTLSRLFSLINN